VIRRAAALAAIAALAAPGVAQADGPQLGVSSSTEGPVVNGTRYVTVPLAKQTLIEKVSTQGGGVSLGNLEAILLQLRMRFQARTNFHRQRPPGL